MELIISQVINGISGTAQLFIASLGLVIIFGMLGITNMAHGEFIMLGAYCCCTVVNILHLPFAAGVIISALFDGLFGFVLERTLIRRLYGKIGETLLATFALTYIIQQIVRMIYGPENQNVSMPLNGTIQLGEIIAIPYYNIFLVIMAALLLVGTLLLFNKTSYGMQLRAIIQNRSMTQCLGINTDRIDLITFVYGSALAGLAGALLAPVVSISPGMGSDYMVNGFLAVIMGGLTSVIGTLFGSFVVREVEAVFAGFINVTTAKLIVFVLIIVLIRIRPDGLLASKDKR